MSRYVGLLPGGAAAPALTFVQLRLADAISGTPEDPNSVFNSVTEDADGWDVEIQGASVDALPEGCWYRFTMPAAWRGDGTQALQFRFTEATAGETNWWCQAGIMDKTGLAASSPSGPGGGVRYPTTSLVSAAVSNGADGQAVSLGATPLVGGFSISIPYGTDGSTGMAGLAGAWGKAGGGTYAARSLQQSTSNSGTKVIALGFGTSTDTTGGAVSGKVKVEVALVEILPAGTLP